MNAPRTRRSAAALPGISFGFSYYGLGEADSGIAVPVDRAKEVHCLVLTRRAGSTEGQWRH